MNVALGSSEDDFFFLDFSLHARDVPHRSAGTILGWMIPALGTSQLHVKDIKMDSTRMILVLQKTTRQLTKRQSNRNYSSVKGI